MVYGLYFLNLLFSFVNPGIVQRLSSKAHEDHQYIAVYFSGSDWCSNCYKFKKTVLSDPGLDSMLHHQFLFYTADFPQRTQQADSVVTANEFLAEKLDPSGVFPLLVLTDENWKSYAVFTNGDQPADVLKQCQALLSRSK